MLHTLEEREAILQRDRDDRYGQRSTLAKAEHRGHQTIFTDEDGSTVTYEWSEMRYIVTTTPPTRK